jgi:DHA1 family tetracycline resistance protein-like MFS transporter
MENNSNIDSKGNSSMKKISHAEKMERYQIDKKLAKLTIMLAIFIDVLGYSMILPLLPAIAQKTFGASNFTIGLLIASNALFAFIFAPIWGRLSDKYGRRPFLIISQMGTLAAFLLLGFSDSIEIVFYSRVLDGIFGGQIPIIRAYIIDITDEDTRSAEIGKIMAAMAFGMVFGPAIGGLLGILNWRYPVYVASCLSVLTIILTFKFLIESMPRQRIADLAERRKLMKEQNENVKFSVLTKIVILRLTELFLLIFAFIIINSSFPLVMTLRYNANVAMIGLFASIAGIIMIITGQLLIRPSIEKFGEKIMFLFALLLALSLFLIYPFLYELWYIYVFIIPYMVSHIFTRSIIMTNLSKSIDEDNQGLVSGYAANMQSIAQIIAPLLAYWYLEIWSIELMGITLDAYFMIGFTCVAIMLSLISLALFDIKSNPELFKKGKIEPEEFKL